MRDWRRISDGQRRKLRLRCYAHLAKVVLRNGATRSDVSARQIAIKLGLSRHIRVVQQWTKFWFLSRENGQKAPLPKPRGRKVVNRDRRVTLLRRSRYHQVSPTVLSAAGVIDYSDELSESIWSLFADFKREFTAMRWHKTEAQYCYIAKKRRQWRRTSGRQIKLVGNGDLSPSPGSAWAHPRFISKNLSWMVEVINPVGPYLEKIAANPRVYSLTRRKLRIYANRFRRLTQRLEALRDAARQLAIQELPSDWYRESQTYQREAFHAQLRLVWQSVGQRA